MAIRQGPLRMLRNLWSYSFKALISASILVLLVGCTASQPELVTKTDPYTNEHQFRLGGIFPKNCSGDSNFYGLVEVSIIGGSDVQAFSINYTGASWKFINSKLGLDLLVDGVPSKLNGVPGASTDVGNYGVRESIYYFIDKATAQKISQAKVVRFRASGSKGVIEKCLDEAEARSFERVVRYLK